MGMSNQIPSSRLIQPGVITNASERPASPYEGQCIFQKDTDQLLVWNGSAWVIPNAPAQNPTGLEFIESVSTSGSTINFFNKFNNTYRNYKIIITTTANSTSVDTSMYLTNGSIPYTTANYSSSGYRIDYANAGGVTQQTDIGVAYFLIGRLDSGGAYGTMHIDVFNPFANTVTTMQSQFIDARFTGNRSGRLNTTSSYDGFQLSLSGTWSGTIDLYGYRK